MIRLLIAAAVAVAVCWLGGFGWFLYSASHDNASSATADAIVVLTGGPDRVETGFRLLVEGAAQRLLISGAGDKTDLADLAHLGGIDPLALERHITLGHAAHSTRGNALETASWVRDQRVGTLLVVTSWFHMPRALVELRRAMPEVATLAYPVGRLDPAELIRGGMTRRVIGEYHKYLASLVGFNAMPFTVVTRETGCTR